MLTAPPKSLTEQIYQAIRGDILSCRHRPGARLPINSLCEELGASLGAVRESLSRLAAEGFVISEAQKGFRVAPVSLRDLEDLTATRVVIECKCLERSIARGGVEWESAIVGAFHRLSRLPEVVVDTEPRLSEEWAAAHGTFHKALVAACDSEWLLRIRSMLFDQSDRYRRLSATSIRSDRDVGGEHRLLMEATLARDTRRVCELMESHFRKTAELVAQLTQFEGATVYVAPGVGG